MFTVENIAEFVFKNNWVFAKTMPKNPHEYVNRKKLAPDMQVKFDEFVKYIRRFGRRASFWNREYIYLLFDGYYYWTMGAPVEETYILNRASIKTNRIIGGRMVTIVEYDTEQKEFNGI